MRVFIPALLLLASCATPTPAPAPVEEKPVSPFERRITFNLQRASINTAFDLIARLTGLDIIVNKEAAGTLTMSVNNLPAGEVVDAVAKTFGLVAIRQEDPFLIRVEKP